MQGLVNRMLASDTSRSDILLLQHATSSPEYMDTTIELSPIKFWQVKMEYALLTGRVDAEFERPLLQIGDTTLRPSARSRVVSIKVATAYNQLAHIDTSTILDKLYSAAEVEPLSPSEKHMIYK